MKIDKQDIRNKINDSKIILIGLGEEFFNLDLETYKKVYSNLNDLLFDKNYFIITLSDDKIIDQYIDDNTRIVKMLTEPDDETGEVKNWSRYNKWLTATLNNKLLILELGVGLNFPQFIRFPFEKVTFYNQKSQFIRVHHLLYQLPEEISEKSFCLNQNAVDLLCSDGD